MRSTQFPKEDTSGRAFRNRKSAVRDWQRSLKRLFELGRVPDAHAHRFRDTFSLSVTLAGCRSKRVSILLGHQPCGLRRSIRTWVKGAGRSRWRRMSEGRPNEKPQRAVSRGVHGSTRKNNSFKISEKEWWRRGSRTPSESATPRSYRLSQFRGSPAALRTSKKRHG